MPRNYYVSGGWNVICDSCGKKIKASEAKQRWDGLIVCPADFEMRQPQDFVKARQDKITVPFTRPRPTDAFILVQGVNDPVSVVDVLTTTATYTRNINDFVTVVDALAKTNSFSYSDIIPADDGSDQYIDPTYFLEDYVGANTLGGVSILFGKNQSEAITLVDTFAKQYALSSADSAALLEYVIDAYHKQTSDTLTIADDVHVLNRVLQNAADTVTPSDVISFVATFNPTFADNLTVVDDLIIYKAIPYSASDTVTIADNATPTPKTHPNDSATIADSGTIYFNNYIDPSYFASEYVGSITSI
jgi:hypothetical protein